LVVVAVALRVNSDRPLVAWAEVVVALATNPMEHSISLLPRNSPLLLVLVVWVRVKNQ
jgi:hypothetical protein